MAGVTNRGEGSRRLLGASRRTAPLLFSGDVETPNRKLTPRTDAGRALLDVLHAADRGPLADTLAADWEGGIAAIEVDAALIVARHFDEEAFACDFGGVVSINLPNLELVIQLEAPR